MPRAPVQMLVCDVVVGVRNLPGARDADASRAPTAAAAVSVLRCAEVVAWPFVVIFGRGVCSSSVVVHAQVV
jgi:hypothetical protein